MLTATQQRQIRRIVGQLRARQAASRELGDRARDLRKLQVDARGQLGRADESLRRADSPAVGYSPEERTREREHCAKQVAQARRALAAVESEIEELQQRQDAARAEAQQIAPVAEALIERISQDDGAFRELVEIPGNAHYRAPRQLGVAT